MTNSEILQIAAAQSAIDLNCCAPDFFQAENRVVHSAAHPQARKYLALPFYCQLVSYGGNIVASVHPEIEETVRGYIDQYSTEHCFETPNLHVLNDALEEKGYRVCFMAEYFLPDCSVAQAPLSCGYELRVLHQADFADLYVDHWSNALCKARAMLDVLGVGAYDGETLVGLAACSADCEDMWQIGVDVLPAYRKKGVASALTSRLAAEIMQRGKLPFYCAAWSNLKSVRNALKCGFRPAWVEMTAKPIEEVNRMNA